MPGPLKRLLVPAACGFAAAALVLYLTRAPGPGLSPDTMSYLGAAGTLARGHQPRVPFAEWSDPDSTARLRDYPPLFPLGIAAGMALGARELQAARAVLSLSAAVSAGGVALIAGEAAGPVTGAVAALAVVIAPAWVEDHYVVLSEPLFLALLVVTLGLLARARPRPWAAGIAAAAAAMVRYAGLSLPAACGVWFLLRPGPPLRRLTNAALAGGPGVLAFLLWSRYVGGARDYGWKGRLGPTLTEGWHTLQGWLVPVLPAGVPRVLLTLVLLAVLAVILWRGARTGAGQDGPPTPGTRHLTALRAAAFLAASYAGLVLFSRLFADGAIPFDNRLLSPLFLLASVATVLAAAASWPSWPATARRVAAAAGLAWLAGSAWLDLGEARGLAEDGWGYASADWVRSDLGAWLREDGRRYALYSDNAPSLYSMAHRPSRWLPDGADSATVRALAAAIGARPAAIIGFGYPDNDTTATGETFAKRLGYREVLRTDEGTAWVK